MVEAGHDPRRFAADLLDRFRDLILLDAVPDAAERGLIDGPAGPARADGRPGRRASAAATLTRYAEIVHTALIEMRGTTSPRLVLELLCARMLLPDAAADSAALLQRLERLERRLSAGTVDGAGTDPKAAPPVRAPAAAAARPARPDPRRRQPDPAAAEPATATPPVGSPRRRGVPPTSRTTRASMRRLRAPRRCERRAGLRAPRRLRAPRPLRAPRRLRAPAARTPPTPAAAPGALDAAALRRLWPEVLEVVKQSSRRTRALLDNAQIVRRDRRVGDARRPRRAGPDDRRRQQHLRAAGRADRGGRRRMADRGRAGRQPATARHRPPGRRRALRRRRTAPAAEPDPRDDTEPDDPDAAAAGVRVPGDPEAEALRLLQSELGARPVEDG